MRNESQTFIGILRTHVHAWRRAQQWSNETMGEHIVAAHERIEGPAITGIVFEPGSHDLFTRLRINGERINRWLDDETKANNLLPANFIPSLLDALPLDRFIAVLEPILRRKGLAFRRQDDESGSTFDVIATASHVIRESSEAQQSLLALSDGATKPELLTAARELQESIDAQTQALHKVEAQLKGDVIDLDQYMARS